MRRCTGLRSRLSYFSITGWNFTHLAVLLAGELDEVDSIERHKTEVLAYLPNFGIFGCILWPKTRCRLRFPKRSTCFIHFAEWI